MTFIQKKYISLSIVALFGIFSMIALFVSFMFVPMHVQACNDEADPTPCETPANPLGSGTMGGGPCNPACPPSMGRGDVTSAPLPLSNNTTSGTDASGNKASGTDASQKTTSSASTTNGVALNTGIKNPLGDNIKDIPTLIQVILNFVLLIGVPIITLAIIYAGFLFVTAAGNSEKLTTAKKTLLFTLIGAALLLGSWVIAQAIKGTVDQINSANK